ncbi:phosphatidylserine decarboxylase [Apiospora kogelbergensis]|uniref:phosphatidylserine decarboxylase n=1 Tax=Apiospora kogelbergensis TaxID=1337665 RepID=UPI00312EE751
MREQQPLSKKPKLVLLFNPVTEWIDTTHVMRMWIHEKSLREGEEEGTPASKERIKTFVDTYGINISRPIHDPKDPSKAVVVADSRVVAYGSVAETKKLWVKGTEFTISNLVMDVQLGRDFADAAVAIDGKIKAFRSLPGDYYQVDPVALQSHVNILTQNARSYVVVETESFGDVLFVAIGATNVGTVRIYDKFQNLKQKVCKGDEIGYFQFGGSSIIVAFQKGRVRFDQDLLDLSRLRIQVSVEVGMSLGRAQLGWKNWSNARVTRSSSLFSWIF